MEMRAYDRTGSILTAFASQVRRRGDAPAAMEQERRFSYAQLDRRSDAAAACLADHGARSGDRIALLAERSLDALIAILAILKTGAAYAPIDLDYPPAAQAAMLADATPRLTVVGRGAKGVATGAPVVDLDELCACAPRSFAAAPRSAFSPAYLMFTSGSTGRPKGVVVPDRAVCRLVRGQSYAAIADDDVLLHASPIAFDASTFEIWGALLNGASVAILRAARPSVSEIVETCARHDVSVAWFTAGLFHLLAERGIERLGSLRLLLAGGDVVSPAHLARARAALPRMTFVNGYGPTENTTFSCCHVLTPDVPAPDGAVPIGRVLSHSTGYVTGPRMTRLGDGEIGEFCVGGDGLALGYLDAPDLTAARFVVAPWGERVYRTGDLVSRDEAGVHRFHGRVDRQVKINGKRVELDALEETLRRRDGVGDAAVLLVDGQRLVGVVKVAKEADAARLAADALADLRAAFPASALPARIVALDAFPLTANGKLDRAALLARADAASIGPVGKAADEMERALIELWEKILRRAPLPADVNLFDLGATSLHLIAAHEAIRERFGLAPPLTLLFEHGDIRSFATALRALARGETEPPRDPRAQARRGGADAARNLATRRHAARRAQGRSPA